MKGWAYIITNKSMPNLLKVGYSAKDPELRATEFNGTGVPHPFVVEYDALVNEPFEVEQKAHALLKAYHENKEWFRCDIATAIIAIRQAANGSIIFETNKKEISLEIERKERELVERQAQIKFELERKAERKRQGFIICPNCKNEVLSVKVINQPNEVVFAILFCLLIIPGVMYWNYDRGYKTMCPKCRHYIRSD